MKRIEERHRLKPPNEKIFEKLDLGDCEKILRARKNSSSFEKLLLHPTYGFDGEEQLWAMYHSLKRFRDATAHGIKIEMKYRDEDLIRLAIDKFHVCFEETANTKYPT